MKQLYPTAEKKYDFIPNAVITDQGNTEILAVKTAFPGVPIFYCAWHVLKAWEREVKKKVMGLGAFAPKQREEIKRQVAMRYIHF